MGMLAAVKENLGLAALFCFMAHSEPQLQCAHPPIPELAKDLWLLTHADMRNVTRIRTFIDFIAAALKPRLDLLEAKGSNVERAV
jgi:DNA-binding transcriptional LysR family regulator